MAQIVAIIMAIAKSVPAVRDILVLVKDEILREELASIESQDLQKKYELDKITAIQTAARASGDRDEIINSSRMFARWIDKL